MTPDEEKLLANKRENLPNKVDEYFGDPIPGAPAAPSPRLAGDRMWFPTGWPVRREQNGRQQDMKNSRTTSRPRQWKCIAVLLAVALLASACGGTDAADEQARIDELQERVDALTDAAEAEDEAAAVTETTSTTTTAAPTTTTTIDPCPAPTTPTVVEQSPPEQVAAAEALTSPTALAVTARGSVTVGVGTSDDAVNSFESLLIDEVIARMFGDVTVERVPLGVAARFDLLPTVDLMIRNTLASTSRSEFGLFTSPYMVEGTTLASRAGEFFNLTCFTGTLAVLAGTTTAIEAEALLREFGSTDFELVEAEGQDDLLKLLDSGVADLAAVFPVLYLGNAANYEVVANAPIQPINAWVFEDAVFRDELDAELARIIADGTWESLYVQSFGESPYFRISDMRAAPPADF